MKNRNRGRFHHIDLNVTDLEASKRVYRTVLGFLGYAQVKDDPDGSEWDIREDGQGASLGLRVCDPEMTGHVHRRYAPGLHHLSWRADSRADVDALHRLLLDNQIKVLDPPAAYPQYSGDYYAVFFEDPDGMKLEYVYAPAGFDARADFARPDERNALKAGQGAPPARGQDHGEEPEEIEQGSPQAQG